MFRSISVVAAAVSQWQRRVEEPKQLLLNCARILPRLDAGNNSSSAAVLSAFVIADLHCSLPRLDAGNNSSSAAVLSAFVIADLHSSPNGRERDWYADDRNGNMYYFNICADANDVPESCQYLEKAVQAPVYQVSNESDCFWLGQLRSMEWELIDENEPAAVSPCPLLLLLPSRRRSHHRPGALRHFVTCSPMMRQH